jgi:hypothetical protein
MTRPARRSRPTRDWSRRAVLAATGVTTERTDVVAREEASPSEPAATSERTTGTAVPGLGVVEGLVALAVAAVKVR